ncbi:hypothetical protein MtrunA17_Chr4g0031551 [Medicago truncatula]|uniref:Uncharacterized protein n=1 Tax=Medicago truncatula TaxID=3880 RepID=A0A396I829_MEDTR|nr:hypothetical protein MtrunA17_Chr4g0031551 [Medicago truncatula]
MTKLRSTMEWRRVIGRPMDKNKGPVLLNLQTSNRNLNYTIN